MGWLEYTVMLLFLGYSLLMLIHMVKLTKDWWQNLNEKQPHLKIVRDDDKDK